VNEQEMWWEGDGGSFYTKRQAVNFLDRVPFWKAILEATRPRNVLDVGCGAGYNLQAIREVDPRVTTVGVDINRAALQEATAHGASAFTCRAVDVATNYGLGFFDLVCTSGVLIHVAPEDLQRTMQAIVDVSSRWVLAVEYSSPTEEEIQYRGQDKLLWKRPYGMLYRKLGLAVHDSWRAQGFDRCQAWLMRKP
jgi:pseudaminic acid biosynthesis-associated methylase